jgi:hypothetical protein
MRWCDGFNAAPPVSTRGRPYSIGVKIQMPEHQEPVFSPKSNFDLLLQHLPQDGLAAALVAAHVNRGTTSSIDPVRQVVEDQLAMLKAAYVEHSDQ